jgi:hypothetical protein
MLELWGATHVTDTYADLGFRSTACWHHLEGLGQIELTLVLLGDEVRGPAICLTALPPGADTGARHTYAHASDSLRMQLSGDMSIGEDRYRPGDFRFQRGGLPYPGDSRSSGPFGSWQMVMLADRRGVRVRLADEDAPKDPVAMVSRDAEGARLLLAQVELAQVFGIGGDPQSNDPGDAPDHPSLVTTLGDVEPSGKVDGSFADQESFNAVGEHARAAYALLGDPVAGPVVVLASTEPLRLATPATSFETDVLRVVLSGSFEIDGRLYEPGDVRVQRAGTWCESIAAGPDGLEEIIVLGDRRSATPQLEGTEGWAGALDTIVAQLRSQLDRATAPSS